MKTHSGDTFIYFPQVPEERRGELRMCLCSLDNLSVANGASTLLFLNTAVSDGGRFWMMEFQCKKSLSVSLQIVRKSFCIIEMEL